MALLRFVVEYLCWVDGWAALCSMLRLLALS
jgi:hypothetical protein